VMAWFPWQGCGLTSPAVGWLAFAAVWVAGYLLARACRRYEERDGGR